MVVSSDDRLFYLITETQRVLMAHLKDRLHQEGVRLSPAQAGLLFLLIQRDGRTMTEVSRLLYADNSSISRLVDRMENTGWVSREREAQDRRAIVLRISDQGRKEAAKARDIVRMVNEEIKACLEPEEAEVFKKILRRLTRTYQRDP
ncbi:MAG: MarR family transcriptional regulator [Desulfobacteraceae bacterium]|nr:MAG: MarR family transcriptional regulator [Desulfobacteraceae bacterium]